VAAKGCLPPKKGATLWGASACRGPPKPSGEIYDISPGPRFAGGGRYCTSPIAMPMGMCNISGDITTNSGRGAPSGDLTQKRDSRGACLPHLPEGPEAPRGGACISSPLPAPADMLFLPVSFQAPCPLWGQLGTSPRGHRPRVVFQLGEMFHAPSGRHCIPLGERGRPRGGAAA